MKIVRVFSKEHTERMTYAVGTRVDLTYLNPHESARPVQSSLTKFLPGTRISFLKMAKDLIVLNITEPSIALVINTAYN